jgi:hypothetical protein
MAAAAAKDWGMAASEPSEGTLVVPLTAGHEIDIDALTHQKHAMLCAELENGKHAAAAWIAEDESRSRGGGMVVIRGKFQPFTFGHEMMLQFAHGFSQGAKAVTGNPWPIEFAISDISPNMLTKQTLKDKHIISVSSGANRREAAAKVVTCEGGRKRRGQRGGMNPECEQACLMFHVPCYEGLEHVVLVIGTDAAAPQESDCLSVYRYGEKRSDSVDKATIVQTAHDAIYSIPPRPVALSASLVRAAMKAGRDDILAVAEPIEPKRQDLFRNYKGPYLARNAALARGGPKKCPFGKCEKAFASQSAARKHFSTCPHCPVPKKGGRRTHRRRKSTSRRRSVRSHKSVSKRAAARRSRRRPRR